MERERGETSSHRRGVHGALANKRAADARALALVSTIRELRAAGIISRPTLAHELNRRGILTAHGGKWHTTTVVRMLARLGLLTSGNGGRINNGQAGKRAADARAEAFGPTIRKLRRAGVVSITAIARELNERGIPTARGGKWHLTAVARLLERLERLEFSSRAASDG
jgi:arylsulfatase A-like enzyme